ncbi:MAG TPA: NAD(P)/FAD-dependent oxidoreductase, partial [Bdellovibrionales bacterium]|nr:NAD(P)/FAD-dependent oxidoreductase [Bdellovibrionales bacterium]
MQGPFDVIIVGAGAAGLACAAELLQHGKKIVVLEARDRVGGRIHTLYLPESPVPVELGAEFIHGDPAELLHLTNGSQIPFYDGCDNHLLLQGDKLRSVPNFWDQLGKVMKRLDRGLKADRSLREFIEKSKGIDSRTRRLFTAFVEGFHSADLAVMGEKGLADAEQSDEEDLNESLMFRLPLGYERLLKRLSQKIPNPEALIRLSMRVRRVEWKRGEVTLKCESALSGRGETFRAKKAVITVPLGVLKADLSRGLEWAPVPGGLESALTGVHMGDVQRLVFRFRSRFWEQLSKEPVGFLHTGPEYYFPTWWTFMPMRTPHLVAWQGGPKARELAAVTHELRVEAALRTLSALTGKPLRFLNAQMEACHGHDWSNDPFCWGAYSYIGVGGMNGAARLRKPFDDTIYLAGEHTASGPNRGTVG